MHRRPTGIILFEGGFRPFFLAAGIWAVAALGLWLGALAGGPMPPSLFDPLAWHAHEMIFGYAMAVIAGFLLTAIPNWTGRLPIRGRPLAALAGLWLAGRLACLGSAALGTWPAAALDLAFPALLLAAAAREIVAGRNRRNLVMVAMLAVLLAANLLVHLHYAMGWDLAAYGWRLGLAAVLFLIALVGGRIVPSFTRNWLVKRQSPALPAAFGRFDQAALLATAAALIAWTVRPESAAAGWLALAAAALNGLRLGRWRGWRTLAEPLLTILHLGYGWLVLGLGLLGLSLLTPWVPAAAALHALAAGAVATMTVAVMTRATLGHSGRALTAGAGTVTLYALVMAAAALRVAAPFFDDAAAAMTLAAGLLWIAGFGLFVLLYGPLLVAPRQS